VTILFADLAGSTDLGDRLDPEALSRVMDRYFDALAGVVASHGGTVEKYIGDAVMAVFGVPRLHEDDALRAVRSAAGIVAAVQRLNDELGSTLDTRLEVRIGLNTGDVVANRPVETGQRLVTGDAVNVASRLQDEADPGDVILSRSTYELVGDRVRVGPATEIELRGKRRPVIAYRLEELLPAVPFVHSATSLVGRRRELERLLAAFDTAMAGSHGELFTIIGDAGVGKSRLAWELGRRLLGRATVVRGRCLAYGSGVTYWPIAEVVRAIVGIAPSDGHADAQARLDEFVRGDSHGAELATRLGQVIGLGSGSAPQEELYWSVRRLFELVARREPLVVVVDDIHWAQPTLLDLLDYLAEWIRDVPVLLVCIARPDLLEQRPAWGGGRRNASTLLLEPLDAAGGAELLGALAGPELPGEIQSRIADAADGNPLFIEELFRMLVARGSLRKDAGHWVVADPTAGREIPATIQALLAARLDQLEPAERAVAQAAAVVGRVFDRDGVGELVAESIRPALPQYLEALGRKEIVRADQAAGPVPDRFRFRHDLIRDAAYASLPKIERADLHERHGRWLEGVMADRIAAYDAIIANHFEQAYRYRREIGELGTHTEDLGRTAGRWLARAGQAANQRSDVAAAAGLLSRALELLDREDPLRVTALIEYGDAVGAQGDYSKAGVLLDDALQGAVGLDPATARRARLNHLYWRFNVEGSSEALGEDARRLADECVISGDGIMAARSITFVALLHQDEGDLGSARTLLLEALAFAERSADSTTMVDVLTSLIAVGVRDMTPSQEVIAECRRVLDIPALGFGRRASCLDSLAVLLAMRGEFEGARDAIGQAADIDRDLGIDPGFSRGIPRGLIEQYAGDPLGAEAAYRTAYVAAHRMGDSSQRFIAARLARVLVDLGRDAEALALTEEAAGDGRLWARTLWRGARARIYAHRGRTEEAVALAQTMLAEAREGGFEGMPNIFAAALEDAAAAMRDPGHRDEARRLLEDAIGRYEAKGNVASARLARRELATLTNAAEARSGRGGPERAS
jgi:class 3 adenylate cyclase/tetratricopeptide (TPR) repeat protein